MARNLITIIFKSFIFLVLLASVLKLLEPLFTESKISVWDNFYVQEENSVDVLILGNSHANAGIDQDVISAKLNLNAVTLATRGQNIYQSYYCALEAYKYQTPKVLIIENFLFYERLTMEGFVNQDPTINDYMKRYITFEGKKFGEIKIEESTAFFKGNIIENMFPVIKKHDRWTDVESIKKRLYTVDKDIRQKGTTVLSVASAQEYKTKTKFNLNKYNVLPEEEKALQGIVDLAIEKGTKTIILLTIPFYKGYRNKIDYKSLDDPLKRFANKNSNITYLDLNSVFYDWDRTYFSNDPVSYNQHLNYKGAIVVSNYLVDIIGKTNQIETKNIPSPEYYLYNAIKKDSTINNNRLLGNLETINGTKELKYSIIQGNSAVVFDGWMAIENLKSENYNLFIGLVKDNNFIYVTSDSEIKQKVRKDVTKYFDKEKGLYDYSGFHININSDLLQKGTYNLYLMLKNDNEILLKKTRKVVEIE
jgi:hypothetical protein